MGCGGPVVSMLAFYFENPSLNPAEAYSLYCKILCFKRTKINKKRPVLAHLKNIYNFGPLGA